jgi:hypothetical protein
VRYFCTYFDSNYLSRGLALYRSLVRHAGPFRLWVLCFDDATYGILQHLALPEVRAIALVDFEKGDEQLLRSKHDRSRIEYYFTCTSSLPLYIFRHWPEVDVITYLDADLFFFSAPLPIYEELADNSILIVEHRFPAHLQHLEKVGIYNVGLLCFRKDQNGLACLDWWRQRCLEWCHDRAEEGGYADQKYLDDWPERFSGVRVLQHKGAGLAPWNVSRYVLGGSNGELLVDSQPLVFYHFHGFKPVSRWVYDPNLARYGVRSHRFLKRYVYGSYIRDLHEVRRSLHEVAAPLSEGSVRITNPWATDSLPFFHAAVKKIGYYGWVARSLVQGRLWLVIGARIV